MKPINTNHGDTMQEPCLKWEPVSLVPLFEIQNCIAPLVTNRAGVTIMGNGTLLFLKKSGDDIESARLALDEAKYLTDFRVKQLPSGDFLVALHSAVAVFVGRHEFAERKAEINARIDDLKFPYEELLVPHGWTEEEYMVGLYGRAKLQRDIHDFAFKARID